MGNKPAEKKSKKKGRPSLLDLQKRSLRLQNQNPNPKPNTTKSPPAPGRRITRRNPDPDAHAPSSSSDDGGGRKGRTEKKLKLVHRIPNSADSESKSDKGERNNSSKGTDALEVEGAEESLVSGPTTPLPDKKLLVFILDRLQKKDAYGVFSDPVDPEELPDYHEIIEHPMDFGTVRKKLSCGAYASLEQFEKDVNLISSNAMCYNAPDTIYYRQARAIHELAKKNFDNLRQVSDDNEPEPKTVARRGRPPNKNIKRPVGKASVDRAASDFSSDATLANTGQGVRWSNLTQDLSRKGSAPERAYAGDVSTRAAYNLHNIELYGCAGIHKSEPNEDYLGDALKGSSVKYRKKLAVADENRRNTYNQPQASTYWCEPSIFTTFDREKKYLMPFHSGQQIGLQLEHAYARSLARFAANLGPTGWVVAARMMERALPSGAKFGRGWVGENEAPRLSQPLILSSSPQPSYQPKSSLCSTTPQNSKLLERLQSSSSTDLAAEEGHPVTTSPPVSRPIASNRSSTSMEVGSESAGELNHEGGSKTLTCGGDNNIQLNSPFQFHQNAVLQPTANGHTTTFDFNLPSKAGQVSRLVQLPGPFGLEASMSHGRALDMVSRGSISNSSSIIQMPKNHFKVGQGKLVNASSTVNSGNSLPDQGLCQDQGSWRNMSQQPKQNQGTVPHDLNVRFQSLGSPATGVMVDPQQPDLALQL